MATQTTDLELRIRAALEGIESITGFKVELSNTGEAAAKLTQDASKLDSALEDLNGLQQQIQRQRDLQGQLNETAAALESARDKQRALSQQVVESFGPTQKQISEQQKAATEVQKLETRLDSARERQRALTQQVIAADEPSASLTKRHENATRRLEGLERALATARQRQEAANKAVEDGGEPNEKLIRQHERQTDTVESLEAELKNLQSQLQRNGQALNAAGVATGQLDAASGRIAQTFQEVTAKAKAFADAQANLKFIPHEQLQREAQGLRDSYEVLRSSGKLSSQELAQANLKLQQGLLDLERKTNGWKDALVSAKVEIGSAIAAFAPIGYAIKQASDFETALAGVRKVVDGTDEQFDGLTTRIRELSRELPISAAGLAEIAAAGGQLGIPIDKLDQFIKLSAQVSVAFNMTAEQAGQAVAKLSNIFDIPLDKVGELASSINVLGNTTAATEGQILDFLTRVGGSARQFGLTAESVAALGASLIAMGRTPEVAATAVNALLVRLQAANVLAPKARQALDEIGLSAEELARQIRENPQAALETFLGTLEDLDGQARTEAIARILGVEQADKIAQLVGNINQYRDALKNATDQQQVAGALQKEFDAQAETTRQQYQLLKNVLGDIVITLGTAFLPAVKAAIGAGKEVAEAIAAVVDAAPGLSAVAVTLVSVGAAMSGLRIATAAARVALTGIVGSATSAATSIAGVGTAALTTTASVSGLTRALALIPRLTAIGIALTGAEAVIGALINIRQVQKDLAETEARVQADLQRGMDDARDRMVRYQAQAQGSAAAIEAVARGVETLTGSQREHYASALKAAEEYAKAQIAYGVREKELTGQTRINLQQVSADLKVVRAAQDALGVSAEAAAEKVAGIGDPAVVNKVVVAAGTLDSLKSSADAAKQATDELTEAETRNKEAKEALIKASDDRLEREKEAARVHRELQQQMQEDAKDTATAFRESIGGASTRDQLEQLRVSLSQAFSEGKLSAEEFQAQLALIDARLRDIVETFSFLGAYSREGIEGIEQASSRIQAAAEAAYRSTYDYVRRTIPTMQTSLRSYNEAVASARQAAQNLVNEYLEQRRRADELTDQLASGYVEQSRVVDGMIQRVRVSGQDMITIAQRATTQLNLLDDQELSGLRSAIDAARNSLLDLRDAAADTLANVTDDLDRLLGKEDEIEKRRQASRLAEVQAQLEAARAAGDAQAIRDLEAALRIQQQISDITLERLAAEARARTAQEQQATRDRGDDSPALSPAKDPAPRETVTTSRRELTLNIPGLRSATVTGPANEIDALEDLFLELQRRLSTLT